MFKPNENTIKRLLLEIYFLQVVGLRFSFGNQNIIRSHKFFEYVSYLEKNGLININKNGHKKTTYTVTDRGQLYALLMAKRTDIEKKYLMLARDIKYEIY